MARWLPTTLRGRVGLLAGGLMLLMAGTAGLALYQLERAAETLARIHADRVVPLVQLKDVSDGYAVTIVDTAHKVADGQLDPAEGAVAVARARAAAQDAWQSYLLTRMTPREQALIEAVRPKLRSADAFAAGLQQALQARDADTVRRLRATTLYPAIDPLTRDLDALVGEQRLQTERELEAFAQQRQRATALGLLALLLGFGAGGLLALRIDRAIHRSVDQTVRLAEAVAERAPLPEIGGGSDRSELGRIEGALRQMSRQLDAAMDQVNELARRDPLTGLLNRRAFDELLQRSLALGRRRLDQACLLFVDLDHFKAINDRFGHAVGDEVLRHAARTLHAALREVDTVARFGGEEFVILLPATPVDAAARVAERLRVALAEPPPASLPRELRLSASIGVTALRADDDGDGSLRRADEALYAAKAGGRNRVVVH